MFILCDMYKWGNMCFGKLPIELASMWLSSLNFVLVLSLQIWWGSPAMQHVLVIPHSSPSVGGLPGPAGVLFLRRGAVLVSSSSWGGSAGAGLHLDPPKLGRGQPRQPPTCQLPHRCDRRDYGPVEEKLAAESEGGCRHRSQRGGEFQEAVWFHPRGTRRLQQAE